jgi:hypothetical protein
MSSGALAFIWGSLCAEQKYKVLVVFEWAIRFTCRLVIIGLSFIEKTALRNQRKPVLARDYYDKKRLVDDITSGSGFSFVAQAKLLT